MSNPIHTGAALAGTVAVGYAACLGALFGWLSGRPGRA